MVMMAMEEEKDKVMEKEKDKDKDQQYGTIKNLESNAPGFRSNIAFTASLLSTPFVSVLQHSMHLQLPLQTLAALKH